MALETGSRLGHYDVTALIGEGGMGQVYEATDTTLDRDVALKVLPDAFTADPDRLARFEREAKVLASLNHPNIGAIYGLEKSGDTRALVLELVEGPTLADRIKHGPIPLDEALPIAKQIAEALEAAHEAGVIHRDLKPANIKVRDDGTVKVLDFGLAKALDPNPEGDPSQSPTLTAAATQMGVIMGTAAYMSPEQAAGRTVDKRGDVWSFGVVLFEMLTGQRLFTGETVSHVLGAVLQVGPKWDALPTGTPPPLRKLLKRCLEKERGRRLRDIGDALAELEEAAAPAVSQDSTPAVAVRQPAGWKQGLPWALGALLLGSAVTGVSVWLLMQPPVTPPERFAIASPPGMRPFAPTISPDGRMVVFEGSVPGQHDVYVRLLSELDAIPLRGGEDGWPNGISPDGQFILVTPQSSPRMLQRVPLDGGLATPITDDPNWGSDWGRNDTIVQGSQDGLWMVPASGGERTLITTTGEGERSHANPRFMPDGHDVLFHVFTGSRETSQVAVYDNDSGQHRTLVPGVAPQFAQSGHLMFWRAGSLWAVPFDPDLLELSGTPAPVVDGVWSNAAGFGGYTVGTDGTLAYVPEGQELAIGRTLVWVDRNGQENPIAMTPRPYNQPRISPDGRRIVVDTQGPDSELFLYDLDAQVEEQFTFERAQDAFPLWTPDGMQIVFSSSRDTGVNFPNLYIKPADGSGTAQRLSTRPYGQGAGGWIDNGETLVFGEGNNPETGLGLFTLQLGTDAEPEVLFDTPANEGNPSVSPNGRWMAYRSDASGEQQLYVRPFRDASGGAQRLISNEPGATDAVWGPDGRELFYLTPDAAMAVEVDTGDTFQRGTPRRLFSMGPYYQGNSVNWDISPDGQRFLMIKQGDVGDQDQPAQLIVVQNWFEELKRLVPTP